MELNNQFEPKPSPDKPEISYSEARRNAVNKIAGAMEHKMSPGDIAELRKLRYDDPSSPAFWKITADYLDDLAPQSEKPLDEFERKWACILAAMAITQGLHRPGFKLGDALSEAGLSEMRFSRLLRATGKTLMDEIITSSRFLNSKAVPFDLNGFADLLFSDGTDFAEPARRKIARSYFYHETNKQK